MTNIDLTPFYRSFIGFDHLANLMDAAARNEKQPAYPPYNIEVTGEDQYRITMAVAGFDEQELSIETEHNTLLVYLLYKINSFIRSLDPSFPKFTLSSGDINVRYDFCGPGYALPSKRGLQAISYTKTSEDMTMRL
jgi:hypothetical protein